MALGLEQIHTLVLLLAITSRLQSFAHAKSDRAIIQSLIVLQHHAILITHSDQQKAPLSAVYRYLPDNLIEKLREEALTFIADTILTCCLSIQSLIEGLLQIDNVHLRSWLW